MLDAARRLLAETTNVEFRLGSIDQLPLDDEEVDAAMVSLVLHHLARPEDALRSIARALRPGGPLLVIDMVAHDRESYRHTMGHEHLGFAEEDVRGWAEHAGFETPVYRRLRPDTEAGGPGLFVATMRRK